MTHTDLLCPDAGIFVALSDDRGIVAFHQDREIGGPEAEIEFEPSGPSLELSGALIGTERHATGTAKGTLRGDDKDSPLECHAIRSDLDRPADADAVLRRSIAISLMDGGIFVLAAARGKNAGGHGDEDLAAAFAGPGDSDISISEALLSTEYDESGAPRRATLELYPVDDEDDVPMRGAGSAIAGVTREGDGWRTHVSFFRWSIEGRNGLGRYEMSTRR